MLSNLVGKSHTFPDGQSIEITQVKLRDENQQWVTYQVVVGPGIPRRHVMELTEFINTFGHLFNLSHDT